jgi:hypothetical protein
MVFCVIGYLLDASDIVQLIKIYLFLRCDVKENSVLGRAYHKCRLRVIHFKILRLGLQRHQKFVESLNSHRDKVKNEDSLLPCKYQRVSEERLRLLEMKVHRYSIEFFDVVDHNPLVEEESVSFRPLNLVSDEYEHLRSFLLIHYQVLARDNRDVLFILTFLEPHYFVHLSRY